MRVRKNPWELNNFIEELGRDASPLIRELMELLDEGATVESGNLTAEIRQVAARRVDFPKLVAVIGTDRAEELRSRVEPSVSRQLILRELDSDQDSVASKREWGREVPRSWEEILSGVHGPNRGSE